MVFPLNVQDNNDDV